MLNFNIQKCNIHCLQSIVILYMYMCITKTNSAVKIHIELLKGIVYMYMCITKTNSALKIHLELLKGIVDF